MIDVDYFKLYNDEYGHVRGDECLRSLAFAVSKVVARPTDCIARYGGEEFVVVLPNTDAKGMKFIAQKIQKTVSLLNIKHEKSPHELVTVSIGGVITQSTNHAEELLSEADKNLYRAKASGRNKIFLSEDVDRIAQLGSIQTP